MTLKNRTMQFDTITHHANVTQCLGSIQGNRWYVGVARPTIIGATERLDCELQSQVLHGNGGYSYLPPRPEDVRLFRVDGPRFLKLHVGTWHAGPLFCEPSMDFYNLELSNTNVILQLPFANLLTFIISYLMVSRRNAWELGRGGSSNHYLLFRC